MEVTNYGVLLCTTCGYAYGAKAAKAHMTQQHKEQKYKIKDNEWNAAITACNIRSQIPQPPSHPIPPLYGLPCHNSWKSNIPSKRSPAIPQIYSNSHNFNAYLKTYNKTQPDDKQFKKEDVKLVKCVSQKFNKNQDNFLFEVIHAPLPLANSDAAFLEAKDLMNTEFTFSAVPADSRNIGSWESKSELYKIIGKHKASSVMALVAVPKDNEFPGLVTAVEEYINACAGMIPSSSILVRQYLRSEKSNE